MHYIHKTKTLHGWWDLPVKRPETRPVTIVQNIMWPLCPLVGNQRIDIIQNLR